MLKVGSVEAEVEGVEAEVEDVEAKVEGVEAKVEGVEVSLVQSMAIVYGLLAIVVLFSTLIVALLAMKNHASAEKERKTGAAYNPKDDDVNIYHEPFAPA